MGIRYAKNREGVHIAYYEQGTGVPTIVLVGCWTWSFTEMLRSNGDEPFIARLAEFAHVIAYDQRGTGCSDPVAMETMASLDQWLDDLVTVLDAAGCERAVLFGYDAAGPLAALFAATYPERTQALVLASTFSRVSRTADYPCGIDPEQGEHLVRWVETIWESDTEERLTTAFGIDVAARDFVESVRRSASPGAAIAVTRMQLEADVRAVLPAIHVPTLVLHGTSDRYVDICHGKYLAANIPDAVLKELDAGHALDVDAMTAEIERFLTGKTQVRAESRALATIVFTDITQSTQQNAALGDKDWRRVLDAHDAICAREVEQYGGRLVKHVGDGVLAVFDGPGRAIRCVAEIRRQVLALGLSVRAGLHTGEVELRGDDILGMAVNIASRISDLADPGEIVLSRTVADLVVGSGLAFRPRGTGELKGVPGTWEIVAYDEDGTIPTR